jgi:LemA protein
MEEDGILTPVQAAMLRQSLRGAGTGDGTPVAPRRRLLPARFVAATVLVLGIGLLVLFATLGVDQTAVQDVTQTLNQPGGHGDMNRSFSALLAVALLLIAPLLMWTWLHNSLVGKEEKVFESWAQTESNFQRRADLVPALVDTVSRYLKHESETLIGIAEERSEAATRVSELVDELIRTEKESADILREEGKTIVEDEQRLKRLFETQAALQRGMNNLFAVVEAYPELRSSDQFLELQAQLEGTENRINVARLRFNDAVLDYNGTMRMLPWSLVANLGKFQRKAYFRSEEEARGAPELQFE